MKSVKKKIFAAQRDIRAVLEHFVSVNLKLKKTDVTEKLKEGILPAGTVVDEAGKPAKGETAFGIVMNDIDFNDSTGTEVASILVHGFVDKAKIQEYTGEKVADENVKALSLIKFL